MSLSRWLFRAVTMASLLMMPLIAINLTAKEFHSGSHCAGTPNALKMIETESCDAEACTAHGLGGYTLFVAVSCNVIDRFQYTKERFKGNDYVMMEEYSGAGCQTLVQTTVYPTSGVCERSSALADESNIVRLDDNGTAVVLNFKNGDCGSSPSRGFQLNREEISNGDCIQEHYSGGVVAIIVVGVVACVGLLAYATFRFIRHRYDNNLQKDTGIAALAASYAGYPTPESALNAITLGSESSYSQDNTITEEKVSSRSGASGLWDDEIIITARVPREKVLVQDLISRGGYGEVYAGLFNGERVAVKMLLPEMRKSISHLNDFLAEVKLMATLNHERIVHFVGVAWDSLTDLCVLSEYMEGGDLRNQHLLPYASSKDKNNSGRAMPDLAILQLVASGKLRIEFSSGTPKAIRDLGMACVSIDPKNRPSAADALFKLHTFLAWGL
ncbi:unnamed protein product [Peronospora destructor]|uniref:Protein kinase domain-containing protein n=1 Tax=Peronospora destructor TaxID=86335 RepID=A0AAV0TKR8_9STRA|nr:unnamed protein product [Peronospora destructor]